MRGNPYVGPASLAEGQRIYGRDREIATLSAMLIAERVVLLYSPSGAGKSSLVQAGIVPAAKKRGFTVRPVLRVNAAPPPGFDRAAGNRYALSCLLSADAGKDAAALSKLTLAEYFGEPAGGELLVFDQFEEVLTVDPTDDAEKREFFGQLGDLLRVRRRWALFAMREDYLAGIDPYADLVPTRFSNTFRLDLLGAEAAVEAIRRPASEGAVSVDFEAAAAAALVENLRQIQVQMEDGSAQMAQGKFVEPVQLQLACYRLWEDLPEGSTAIREVGQVAASVDQALESYYTRAVSEAAVQSGVTERALRDWFDNELITRRGTRTQVTQGDDRTEPVRKALRPLVDAFLVRSERRLGSIFYELAHDRLVQPVQASNRAWRQQHLSPFQRSAELWEEQKRSKDGLLRGEALAAAREWAAANEMTEVEKAFLEASVEADAARVREERAAEELRQALADARRALARFEMEQVWRLWGEGKPALALAHLAAALRMDAESKRARLWAASFFARGSGRVALHEVDHGSPISVLAFSGDGRRLLTGYCLGTVRVWNVETGAAAGPELATPVHRAKLSYDGRLAITFPRDVVGDPTAYVWEVESGKPIGGGESGGVLADTGGIVDAWVTRDGKKVVAVGGLRGVFTVDLADLRETAMEGEAGGPLSVAAMSEDEGTVATAGVDGVRVWDLRSGSCRVAAWEAVAGLAVSADGGRVLVRTAAETVVWTVASDEKVRLCDATEAAGFASDGGAALTVDARGVSRWTLADGSLAGEWGRQATDRAVEVVAGGRMVAVLEEEKLTLRDAATFGTVAQAYPRGPFDVWALAGDGGLLAGASCAQPVATVWEMGRRPAPDQASDAERAAFTASPPPKPIERQELVEIARARWGNREVPRFVRSAVFSPSQKRLLVSGEAGFYFDEPPEIWDGETGALVATVRPGGSQGPMEGTSYTAAFSADDRFLGIADSRGWVQLFDAKTGIHLGHPISLPPPIECGLFTAAGTELLAGVGDGTVRMWSPQTALAEGGEWFEHAERVVALMESGDGARLVTSTGERLCGWDLRLGGSSEETAAVLADLAEALGGYRKAKDDGPPECLGLDERRGRMRELAARADGSGDARVALAVRRIAGAV